MMRQLLSSAPDLDAVAAMSDELALGAMRVTTGPLRVTGWDDSEIAAEHQLTTMAQFIREQGSACATAALGEPPRTTMTPGGWSVVPLQPADRVRAQCSVTKFHIPISACGVPSSSLGQKQSSRYLPRG
jgi:hypothetical protein